MEFRAASAARFPGYYAAPVPSFGDTAARLLIVGLAPGLHGANRTGRPFTGDYAGLLLYRTLYRHGLASQPESISADDPLRLLDARIVNSVKCVPPGNKPMPAEIHQCNAWLAAELQELAEARVMLALGRIAHEAVLEALGIRKSAHRFAHAAEHALAGGRILVDSYHCSRYNTQTRRLTEPMFDEVVARAADLARGIAS